MLKISRLVICAMAFLLVGSLEGWAQLSGEGGGGRGARGGAMMAMRSVPVEQILGFLAFDDKIGLSDEQLGKVRNELKIIHSDRAKLVKGLAGSEDRDATMTEVRKLRAQMTQKLTAILNPGQVKGLQDYMKTMNQRGGRGGGRGGDGRRRGGA